MKPGLRTLRRVWVGTGAVATVVFLLYMTVSFRASGPAREALRSDAAVRVARTAAFTSFTPAAGARGSALLFFGGAMVDPAAYAPLMRRVAERGYTAILVKLPGRSAPTERHRREALARARSAMREHRGPQWVVGGHSKGGAIAAELAREDPELLAALVLVGTSHPREFDLSGLGVPVVKVYGTRDGLASTEEVRRYASNLPRHTRFVEVRGGNHAQFGYYGFQLGDRGATIPREEQQDQLLRAVLQLLAEVDASGAAEP